MPCCEISDRAQMSKTIIAVRHFALGGRESLETAVSQFTVTHYNFLSFLSASDNKETLLQSFQNFTHDPLGYC